MQKTKEPIYLPLSQEALRWMPERGEKTAEYKVMDYSVDDDGKSFFGVSTGRKIYAAGYVSMFAV